MSSSIRLAIAACLVSGMLCAMPAKSQGGRITFSGAVVVATCTAPAESAALSAGAASSVHAFTCGGGVTLASASNASTYVLSVEHLAPATTVGSPLLHYYAGYLASAHVADATMVTRTYE
ncbi:hypothetical protein [Dyella sp. A6]|uniref:hypothetical protein n=1 Tax=Dyella aluminiiresistens TaxID=3069105 RepID=UPI002E76DDA1|nr:hypothetical protein [Dyella sp. A6]